jgi:hypothetical protein
MLKGAGLKGVVLLAAVPGVLGAGCITPTAGEVAAVTTRESPSSYPQLADCVAVVVRSLKFRRALKPTVAQIPFIFDAR